MPVGGDASRSLTDQGACAGCRVALRILATTDMHMHVMPYDYLADRVSRQHGLARTPTLIDARRAEVANTVLFDNGDFLQGNPLADYAASDDAADSPHPAIAAMNVLGYDAATLGNHEFNYGLSFLQRVIGQARFPVISTNFDGCTDGAVARYVVLERNVTDQDGQPAKLRIGVLGFLPPQTTEWEPGLSSEIICDDMVAACRKFVPELRGQGVDLVIALAHSGIGPLTPLHRMENAATALADVDGIDVVIAGHTHQVFPGPHIRPGPGIDPLRGTLAGKPAVMAGFGGSHLGIIDLELKLSADAGARVLSFDCRAERVGETVPAAPRIVDSVVTMHEATLRHIQRKVGHSDTALNSYFTLIGEDRALRLVNLAQRWHAERALEAGPFRHLPVLAAAAPFRAGGRGGASNYTSVRPGPLTLRNISDIYLFTNRICAIVVSGAQVGEWLERSASIFRRIQPGASDLPLLDPEFPSYNFDVIDGVQWEVDLSAPARFLPDGRTGDPHARRIQSLSFQGRPVAADDQFILVTNSYRLATCGLFAPVIASNAVVLPPGNLTRDVLYAYIEDRHHIAVDEAPAWRFQSMPGTSVLFETGPGALPHLAAAEKALTRRIEPLGTCAHGFCRMRLHL